MDNVMFSCPKCTARLALRNLWSTNATHPATGGPMCWSCLEPIPALLLERATRESGRLRAVERSQALAAVAGGS